ncbi:MAG: FUSC family protein [Rhodoglobus sp.]
MSFDPGLRHLREAVVTMVAVLATVGTVLLVDPQPSFAVLGVVLVLGLSRSGLADSRRGFVEGLVILPAVGLATLGAGLLLHALPIVGAIVFTGGMFLSIWLRRFGTLAARIGSLIALPLMTLLVVPPAGGGRFGGLGFLVPIAVSLVALGWVALLRWGGRRAGLIVAKARVERAASASGLRPVASTRMAIQMAIALVASFAAGYLLFPERWAWIVLTAFIVCSGNRGRVDVAWKSILRVVGAAAGTVVAIVASAGIGGHDGWTVALILVAVFLGIWLRPVNYAFWALLVTIALALLQGFTGGVAHVEFLPRLEEIVVGAILALLATWFVLPVRSTNVARKRLSDALGALQLVIAGDAADAEPTTDDERLAAFARASAALREVRTPFAAWRLVRRTGHSPADWSDLLDEVAPLAIAYRDRGRADSTVLRALGAARRSVREPPAISPALTALRDALVAAS